MALSSFFFPSLIFNLDKRWLKYGGVQSLKIPLCPGNTLLHVRKITDVQKNWFRIDSKFRGSFDHLSQETETKTRGHVADNHKFLQAFIIHE